MVLTGTLDFSEFTFNFVFDEKTLRLIPITDEKKDILFGWKKEKVAKGVTQYIPQPLQTIKDEYIIGICNETNSKIVFLPVTGSHIFSGNNLLNPRAPITIALSAYILFQSDKEKIDRMAFCCPEINYIHPITKAMEYQFDLEGAEKGKISLNTTPFDISTTEQQSFLCENKNVRVYFGISRKVSYQIHEAPLTLTSTMYFEFEPTQDYRFILRLLYVARQFIRFLCYRRNVNIPQIELSTPTVDGKHEKNATLYFIEECESELTTLKDGRYIKQQYIAGHEGEILKDIVENTLYTRHLPETFASGRRIDAARFVLISAAFEWEFKRLYPTGIKHSPAAIKASNEVETKLKELFDESKGKKKKIYKRLLNSVSFDSLASEICQAGKDFSDLAGVFGEHLYKLNGEELDYSKMGERLANQRNDFAHGNIDKYFNDLSILDVCFMEFLIYAMQLKYYKINDKFIQKSINELFRRNLAL